jgi:hypothetical protein
MDEQKELIQKYLDYLNSVFWKAFEKLPFDTLCTVLRVGGLQDANWDPFEESIKALKDFNKLLDKAKEENGEKMVVRIALLMYCQLIEMTAPHEMLANLLRCLAGKPYIIRPFSKFIKKNKKRPFSSFPPSATKKFNEIKKAAKDSDETELIQHIDSFFDDKIRNAFSHSDYILKEEHFRWTEGGLAQQVEIDIVKELINNCFSFYDALLYCHKHWLKELAKLPRYHKWPQHEVLEILSDNNIVYGFSVHFSNGSKATYARTSKGTDATNIHPNSDGTVNFFVGSLDALEPIWKIDGKPVKEWNTNQNK